MKHKITMPKRSACTPTTPPVSEGGGRKFRTVEQLAVLLEPRAKTNRDLRKISDHLCDMCRRRVLDFWITRIYISIDVEMEQFHVYQSDSVSYTDCRIKHPQQTKKDLQQLQK